MPTVSQAFAAHVASVQRLMNFDRDVLTLAIDQLHTLESELDQQSGGHHARRRVHRTLEILQGIRRNDSLRPRYETIFNQALVLLVSDFGSSVADVFRNGVRRELDRDTDSPLFDEELRLIVRELREPKFDVREAVPELLIQSRKISFQDMQSVARAFRDYLEVTMEKNDTVHDIIAAHACRHAIVHTGGTINDRLLKQVSAAKPRKVKPRLKLDEVVQFTPEEIEVVADAMSRYLTELIEGIYTRRCGDLSAVSHHLSD